MLLTALATDKQKLQTNKKNEEEAMIACERTGRNVAKRRLLHVRVCVCVLLVDDFFIIGSLGLLAYYPQL